MKEHQQRHRRCICVSKLQYAFTICLNHHFIGLIEEGEGQLLWSWLIFMGLQSFKAWSLFFRFQSARLECFPDHLKVKDADIPTIMTDHLDIALLFRTLTTNLNDRLMPHPSMLIKS